ncbi:MAG: Gfo/Idh/MocA family protein [Anaerolineales bacterium]
MRVLIVGLGSIGRRHLQNLLALGVKDIALLRSGKSTLPEQNLADFPTFYNLQSALDYHPDAVVIANPSALHLSVAIPFARQGCHLFLEKPISHTLDGVELLKKIVEQNHNKVLVGFQFRFHPLLQKMKQLLDENRIGRPLWARAHWGEYLPNWHPWEDYRQSYSARQELGGGVLLTLCHPFDYLAWFFGKPARISAVESKLSDLEMDVEDTAEVILEYPSNFIASVHLDYVQQPPQHSLEIVGSQGTIRWDYFAGKVDLFTDIKKDGSYRVEEIPDPPNFTRNAMFLAEMEHFLAVVEGKSEPRCSLEDGITSLKIVLAAKQASLSGHQQGLEP